MTFHCSACQRSFAEPGFCPFDGSKLVDSNADAPTLISTSMRAQSEAERTQTRPGLGENTTAKVKAISAHEGTHSDAIATMRKQKVGEYDHLVGETLDGRYHVQRKIGEGGMGVVFAVKHTVIERPLAIKVLKREVMRDKATIQRFIQEAQAASRIGHPNIVDVTDFGKTKEGLTYSVMELVDGTTLAKVIKNTAPLPAERVVRIASQIGRALAAAHAKGIVHRDLKPENVFLVDRDGRPDFVKIVDFGIAKVQPIEGKQAGPRLTRAGAVFGTPEYMAPEQAAGRNDTDHRVDIYALGTILYEMLVGRTPHKGDSMIRTIAMQMLDPITPPSKVHPELAISPAIEAVVMKALAKQREDRYASMTELLDALDKAARGLEPGDGSTLSLPPLPPGADASVTPAPGVPVVTTDATRPRRAKPATRPLHEPEFVAPGSPVSFSHVYDEVAEEPVRPSRMPFILAGILMLALGAGTIFLIAKLRGDGDNAIVDETAKDAAIIVEARDATSEPPADALVIVEVPPDAGDPVTVRVPRDGGVTTLPPGTRTVTVEILTRPGDAEVFVGRNFRGPSGVRITERHGAKVKIECKTDRMKGSVEVVFDGKVSAVMCTATRDRFCVPGLKNPYDDCEEAPL
jgi:serine/threonine protein kinase